MHYLKGYKIKAAIGIIAKLIEAVFELILPLLMVDLIEKGISAGDMHYVYITVLKMFGLTLLGYLSSLVCQYWASVVSQGVGGRIRSVLFRHMSTFSLADYDVFSSATLTNRITNDTNQIQTMVAMSIRLAVRTPILMIGSLWALFTLNAELAKVLLLAFPLFVAIVAVFMYLSLKYYKQAQQKLDILVAKVRETLGGARVIRAFSKTDEEYHRFEALNQKLGNRQTRVGFINSLSTPTITLAMNLVLLLLVYLGAFQISDGSMSQGQIVAVINYCTQLVLTLIVFMNLVMTFSRGFTSYRRVQEILEHSSAIQDMGKETVADGPLKLEFNDVSFSYPQQKRRVLKKISFTLNPGETLGIVGLTGSGKSTLIQLISRFYDVSEGEIMINEQPIHAYTLQSLRSKVGYISQKAEFIEGSLAGNVLMGQTAGNAETYLRHAQGDEILEKGLDSIIRSGGVNLSGGQRQRVNIARALAKLPSLLIFDDSFSALDFLTDRRLRENMRKHYHNTTHIIVTQRTSTIRHAHKVMVLVDGEAVDIGTHEELLQRNALYGRIHALQQEEVSV